MKVYYKEIEVSKGEESSRLHVISKLTNDIKHLFEEIKDPDADEARKMFGADKKTVAKSDYIFKLTVEKTTKQ